MRYCAFTIYFGTGLGLALCFWPPAYKVDLTDRKVFEIGSDETDLDDESEDEMIKGSDLAQFESLAREEERYKPLHSHVERYNKRAARTATEFAEVFPQFDPSVEDIHNLVEEAKPFVAGFKHELDEYDFGDLEERVFQSFERRKRNASRSLTTRSKIDSFQKKEKTKLKGKGEEREPREVPEDATTKDVENSTEMTNPSTSKAEDYDYEVFRAEYYEEMESLKSDNKTFNYTENGEPEESGEDALKKIVDFKVPKNCTKEELTQFGAKALECLAFDYKNAKSEKNVKKILSRTWTVLRVWIFIYLFVAVPCWCQKGWCCCCFNCAFCNPHERILTSKKYYAENPPGILTEVAKGSKVDIQTTEFEPTLFELEAFERFESAIRNL